MDVECAHHNSDSVQQLTGLGTKLESSTTKMKTMHGGRERTKKCKGEGTYLRESIIYKEFRAIIVFPFGSFLTGEGKQA